jgi:hypothetical protein
MIAAIFLSFIAGIAGTLLFAVWYAARPKKPEAPRDVAAVSVNMGSNPTTDAGAN